MHLAKYSIIISYSLFILCCSKSVEEKELLQKTDPEGKYGGKISLTLKNNIDELMLSPNNFLGKEVLVSGEITEVCPMRGCWIDIKDLETGSNIRVKVIDGEIIFPLSAIGRHVDVQGIFTKIEFTEAQAKNWKIHLAEERGLHLKPDEIEITSADLVEYRINGKGADIYTYGCK